MWVSKYFLWFILYSIAGWLFETVYAVVMTGKWENRGFLYGPICPIYGFGAVGITSVYALIYKISGVELQWWGVFAVAFFGSIILEYGTGWMLERFFHAVWWDYSDIPLNYKGRICLPASTLFGITGVVIIFRLDPEVNKMTAWLPPVAIEAFALIVMAVAAADATLTVVALTDFERRVEELDEQAARYMEHFVENMKEKTAETGHLILEERDRIYNQGIERVVQPMSHTARSALRRVKGFRPGSGAYSAKTKELFARAHQYILNKMSR